MKTLVIVFTLATLTTATAQPAPLPRTIQLHDNATKQSLGSATYVDNKIYLRNRNGEHYATIVVAPDGSHTAYDPGGQPMTPPAHSKELK